MKDTSKIALGLHGVGIGYNGKALFAPFDLEIARGTLNVIIGANGSGKSTLLHTIAGVIPPIEGKVEILGIDSSKLSARQRSRKIGMVFTERSTAGGLTVREFVETGRYPYVGLLARMSAEDKRIVQDAMEATGIDKKADCHLAEISDGERQKSMIAAALARQTEIMLFDEPTNFLDVASRLEIMSLIKNLVKEKGITALISTHDVAAALAVADNVITILPDDKQPVSIDCMGSVNADARLNSAFARHGVKYDPQSRDFVLESVRQ